MSETTTDTNLKRIHALLAKAESSTHEAEAESYRSKAYELLAKYGYDAAMLKNLDRDHEPEKLVRESVHLTGKYLLDQANLLNMIGLALHVQPVRFGPAHMQLFGYASDVERVKILFGSLTRQASHAVARAETPYGTPRVRFVKSFLAHFARVVHTRLAEAEAKVVADNPGSGAEVVLVDRTKKAVGFMKTELGRTKTTPVRRYQDGAAAGRAAGERASLGNATIGGNRRQIGG